jgi:hypothetical protein
VAFVCAAAASCGLQESLDVAVANAEGTFGGREEWKTTLE